jgi:PPOX class probable F420-dependent enzyme
VSIGERVAAASNRFYLRIRHPQAFQAAHDDARARDFDGFRGSKYALIVTFKRSGEAVPTPVWFGLGDGKLYFHSEERVGKIKRIRNDPKVLVAPCTMRGKPTGPVVEGSARIVPPAEEQQAEDAIQSKYGLFRRIYEHGGGRVVDIPMVYVEVTPA